MLGALLVVELARVACPGGLLLLLRVDHEGAALLPAIGHAGGGAAKTATPGCADGDVSYAGSRQASLVVGRGAL